MLFPTTIAPFTIFYPTFAVGYNIVTRITHQNNTYVYRLFFLIVLFILLTIYWLVAIKINNNVRIVLGIKLKLHNKYWNIYK